MDSNFSIYTTFLTMESLELPPSNIFPAFIFGTLTYCAILVFNMTVWLTIALNRKLHKPMYVLLFNMPLNDMMGASAFFPQLVSSILSQNRSITYSACFVQALLTHLYGAGSLLILSAMAYDRYIAICCPLKYSTMMSPNNLMTIIIIMWTLDFTLIGFALALNYQKEICSTKIVDIFCNNPSLMKLICGDTKLNNYYGLFTIAFIQGLSLLIVVFTYMQILITVVVKRQSDAKGKAIQTCGTHLIVFLCLEFNIVFALMAHRFETASPNLRKALGASVMIFPPIINPLIYGLKTKEIRQNFIFFFHKRVFPAKQKNKLGGLKRQLQ
ncbi:putative gustatory receptor clone PTE01 [Pygocentrus nattereri]|uniref:putative gustatory receptor clone PTE01 n=1 Tax=Pygocentrus nattereri TaxID=42514 RepID=UPI0008144CB2|nr:putative gustatory receptor clone PTE01 [Pygocentrus nattereri]